MQRHRSATVVIGEPGSGTLHQCPDPWSVPATGSRTTSSSAPATGGHDRSWACVGHRPQFPGRSEHRQGGRNEGMLNGAARSGLRQRAAWQ
ncbi:hypothetical protein, partial [Streptomyces caniscabiei]|uniref:hypothetical protein n=1 Tax=Streptomyces caniscabiei TaxID=2746961 RepID=UPI000B1B8D41